MAFTASTDHGEVKLQDGKLLSVKMGVTKIWKGDQVLLKTDGYAYSAYATGATGDQFAGIAAETVDNTGGAAGDKSIKVYIDGIVEQNIASGAIANLMGMPVYNERGSSGTPRMVTVTAGTHGVQVGNIVECVNSVSACTKVRVKLTAFSAAAS